MERNQGSRSRMASWRVVNPDPSLQGLGVGRSDISDMPIGASDELDILLMRQDHLNKQIKHSFQDLCEQLTSSGIGRGGARSGAFSPSSQMLGAQSRAQKMMAMGRGAVMKKNLVSTNPGVTVSKPEYKCYRCGQGHKSRNCPYWPKDPTVCWKCHSVGHMHRDCKNVVEKATQTPQKMPMFCRKERELQQPNLLERQQRQ